MGKALDHCDGISKTSEDSVRTIIARMNNKWFSNRGQVAQAIFACMSALIASISAYPSLKDNDFLSRGSILFYLLVGVVITSIIVLVKNVKERKNHPAQTDLTSPNGSLTRQCPDPAIHALAEQDLKYASDRLLNISRELSKSNRGEFSYPWVKFHITVYNASVHPLMIGPGPQVKGLISCLGETIPFPPQLEISSTYTPHGSEIRAVITQPLGKEMVEKINTKCPVGSSVDFGLGDLRIPLFVQGKTESVGHWKLGTYTLKIESKF